MVLNFFGTAVPFWGQTSQFPRILSPKPDSSPKMFTWSYLTVESWSLSRLQATSRSPSLFSVFWFSGWGKWELALSPPLDSCMAIQRYYLHHTIHYEYHALTLLEPQSRFGDKPLKFQSVCPQNETAAPKGLKLLL